MIFTLEKNMYFCRVKKRCVSLFVLENRQFAKGNKDKHIQSRLAIALHYFYRAWAVVYLLPGVLAIPLNRIGCGCTLFN